MGRTPRATDEWPQSFWFDDDEPVAASVFTDWGNRLGFDVVTLPGLPREWIAHVVQHALEQPNGRADAVIETMVDDADEWLGSLLDDAGFERSPLAGTAAWMRARRRPPIASLTAGYRLASRDEAGDATTHHLVVRNGSQVEPRLRSTSLYRPDLDLVIVDEPNEVAAYGLFWHDPVTSVGLVEPMRTEEGHQGRGLARHLLTAGLERLASAGASRIKVNFDNDNDAARALYMSAGFEPATRTSVYVRSPTSRRPANSLPAL